MDPRTGFAKSVDLETADVVEFPALLFFCGGPTSNPSDAPLSVRDVVFRAFTIKFPDLSRRIFLAEEFQNWTQDNTYGELFTFEQDLAALSSSIVIFVESAGAIAELGAFSQLDGVRQKLLVFLQTEHYLQNSFIKLGPVKFLEDHFEGSIRPYPWRTVTAGRSIKLDINSLDDSLDEICTDIHEVLSAARVHRKFEANQPRDRMLLIRDVIDQLLGLKIHEIRDYLIEIGVTIEISRLKQFLFVLETLGLIEVVPRGKDRFFVSTDSRRFIRYGTKGGQPKIDPLRLQSEVSAYYRKVDRSRFNALAPILATREE